MNITGVPSLYTGPTIEQELSDYQMGQYFKVLTQAKVITFDSGESSLRRTYIKNTLLYLINIKGISCMVLSSLDSEITKSYLNLLSQKTRSSILNIGLFHIYLNVVQKVRSIMQDLYVSRQYRFYMELYFNALRAIEADLIKQISDLGILVILDRSLISNFLYYKAITNNIKGPHWCSTFSLNEFKVLKSFYVHSLEPNNSLKGSMYDTDQTINYSLRALVPQVKTLLPNLVELPEYHTLEQNMSIIKKELNL